MTRNDSIKLDNLGLESRKMRANLRTRDQLAGQRSKKSQQVVRVGLGSVLVYGIVKALTSK